MDACKHPVLFVVCVPTMTTDTLRGVLLTLQAAADLLTGPPCSSLCSGASSSNEDIPALAERLKVDVSKGERGAGSWVHAASP